MTYRFFLRTRLLGSWRPRSRCRGLGSAGEMSANVRSARSNRLQPSRPRHELIQHRVDLPLVARIGLERREVLEVGEEREQDLGADGRDHELAHDEAQMLDGARSSDAAVAHESRGLVVPLAIEVVDRVLERGGGAVVVFRRHEDVSVEGADLRSPSLRVLVGVPPERRRQRLVEERQLVLGDVDELELGVLAPLRQAVNPARDGLVVTPRARAPGHDRDLQHVLPPLGRMTDFGRESTASDSNLGPGACALSNPSTSTRTSFLAGSPCGSGGPCDQKSRQASTLSQRVTITYSVGSVVVRRSIPPSAPFAFLQMADMA